jgi:hypothetical protein
MRGNQRTSLLLFALLLSALACDAPGLTTIDPNAQGTALAQTLAAIIAATQQAARTPLTPSPTPAETMTALPPTASAIPTQTQTPSLTPTAIRIYTPTPFVPMISVSIPTNCRTGPGKLYDMVGALLVGETAQVYAVDPTHTFWYIRNPDAEGEYCWVTGEFATLSGFTSALPMFTPPPTPSPTLTETPAPDYELTYEGLVSCSSTWWPEFRLQNTGLITFHSIELIVKDTAADVSVSDMSDTFFDQTDCLNSVSKAQLLPGKAVTVSSPEFSEDPTGHKLRASVTLCSDTGQNGFCLTQTITFKP